MYHYNQSPTRFVPTGIDATLESVAINQMRMRTANRFTNEVRIHKRKLVFCLRFLRLFYNDLAFVILFCEEI